MLTDEYVDLVNDIKTNGLKQPIVLFEDMILDGIHRARACAELMIEPTTQTFTGTPEEARAFVLSMNVHRRHLTLDQKRAIVERELRRDPAQSDRAIAGKAKVDGKTVAAMRQKVEGRAEIPHVDKRVDSKGRRQPARKPDVASAVAKSRRERLPRVLSLGNARELVHWLDLALCPVQERDPAKLCAKIADQDRGRLRGTLARIIPILVALQKELECDASPPAPTP
jgi:hypothetical protein